MTRPSPKLRNTRRQWIVIIAAAIVIHALLILFLKPGYFSMFRSPPPPAGEPGDGFFPALDRPFSFIPLSDDAPASSPAAVELSPDASDVADVEIDRFAVGDVVGEATPLLGGAGGTGSGGRGGGGSRPATVEPKPLYIPWPRYPSGVKRIEGTVELLLLVNEKGEVEDVKISRKLPLDILNTTATQAAARIRFTPGMEQGRRKSMWVKLSIGFQPR